MYRCLIFMGLLFGLQPLKAQYAAVKPQAIHEGTSATLPQVAAVAGGLTLAAFLVDEPLRDFMQRNQSGFGDGFSRITDVAGEKTVVVPALLATYGTARWLVQDEELQGVALQAMQAVVTTALATEGLKHLAGRARPFREEGAFVFAPFPGSDDSFKSLPSGHASLAFAVFTPFAEAYSRWLYVVPVAVAAGRVYDDKHWTSDVLLGGALGFVSAWVFVHQPNVSIIPGGLRLYF